MIAAIKRALVRKKLTKCRIELGGVQAEMLVIDKIVKSVKSINNGQMDKLQIGARRVGELQTAIAIYESELSELNRKHTSSLIID